MASLRSCLRSSGHSVSTSAMIAPRHISVFVLPSQNHSIFYVNDINSPERNRHVVPMNRTIGFVLKLLEE